MDIGQSSAKHHAARPPALASKAKVGLASLISARNARGESGESNVITESVPFMETTMARPLLRMLQVNSVAGRRTQQVLTAHEYFAYKTRLGALTDPDVTHTTEVHVSALRYVDWRASGVCSADTSSF